MLHQPFKLLIQVGSPVVIQEFVPSLDGVLYQAVKNKWPEKSHDELLAHLKKILQFDDNLGVFHASCMRFGLTDGQGLSAKYHVRTDCSGHRNLTSDYFFPNGKKSGYNRVLSIGGPYKKRLHRFQSYAAPYVIFNGLGDMNAVHGLISYCLNGLGYDSNNCATGSILDVEIIKSELDESFTLKSGELNKYLPKNGAKQDNCIINRIIPPYYYKTGRVPVDAPKLIRTELIK